MFKNIPTLILAGALALPVAPAALGEYKEYCLHNTGGYSAGFHIEIVKRGPPSPGLSDNIISHKTFWTGASGSGTIYAPNTKCVSARDAGVSPGDAIRVLLNPAADLGKGYRQCGPSSQRNRNFEGFFLVPDGPPQGRLVFKSWGTLYSPTCELTSYNDERMHSACGATVTGMSNGGCNRFEVDQPWDLGKSIDTVVPDAAERNTTVGQLFDLLDRDYDPDQAQRDGSTALHISARSGRGDLMDVLIQRGANLDARMDDGNTPLMEALTSRQLDMAEKLIVAGAHPSVGGEDGDFPLRYAAEQGTAEIVEMLLDHGALVNARHSETGQSALDAAKARQDRGRDEVLNLLQLRGAEDRIYLEVVPNLVAIDAGVDKLERALSEGADVNESTGDGLSGLHIAAANNYGHYMDTLVDHGADINAQDDEGRTPLMTAIEGGNAFFALALLFNDDADPNQTRRDGHFPLYLAVETGNPDLVESLTFTNGIDVNQRHSATDKTALKLADELFERDGTGDLQNIREALLNAGGAR